MPRPAPHVAVGLLLIAAGVAVALLADRAAGIVTALVGAGFLVPLRPGRRPGEGAAGRRSGERRDDLPPQRDDLPRPPDADRDGAAGRRP